MLNIEKYKEDIIKHGFDAVHERNKTLKAGEAFIDTSKRSLVNWLCEEYEEPLLSEDEKEQIRAFKKALPTLERIEKHGVVIELQNSGQDIIGSFIIHHTYKNLYEGLNYTLEDLGIQNEEY